MAVGILDPKKGIVWQGNEAQLPPDVIEQLQALEARKRMGGIDTSPVDHWTQGAARVVDALGGVLRQKRLDNAATENTTYNEGLIGSLLGNSGGSSSMAPNTGEQAGVSQEMNATNPAPVDVSQNGSTYEPFINTLKQGGVTNPYGLAAVAATGKAESGWSPQNAGRTWADPSQSGQAGTAGGVMSWRGPRLAALQSFAKANGESGNGSPETQAKFLLQEDPSLIQALNGAKSVEEAQSRMNRAWAFAGYDKPGGESARRLGYASAYLPKFQGGEAASTPQAAIEAIAPSSGYIDPVVNSQPTMATTLVSPEMPRAAGSFDAGRFGDAAPAAAATPGAFDNGRFGDPSQQAAAPVQNGAPPAGAPQIYSAQSDFVPELPAPVEVSAPPAVAAVPASPQQQVAQAMTAPAQSRSQAPNINAAIIKAISDPRASESTKAIAGLLLKQQQAQAQAEREQQTWMARQQYEQQQKVNDPSFKLEREKFDFQRTQAAQTGDIKEYEYAKTQGFDGSFAEFQQSMKKAGAANTTINTGEGSKFFNKLDEKNAETFAALSEQGMAGRGKMAQIDRLESLMANAPQGAVGVLKQAAGEYGIPTEGLSDIQAATALINQLVPQQRQPGSGTMSDADLALFKQSLPRLINQPGGNQAIIQTMRGLTDYQIKTGEIADRVANRELKEDGKPYSPADARRDIAALPNPLAAFKPQPGQPTPNEGWKEVSPGIRFKPKGS
jgi:hypothetical protein